MDIEPESYDEHVARLTREGRRANLLLNGVYVLCGLAAACMLLGWLLGTKSPWEQVLDWASNGLFLLILLLFVASNVHRPKFVREFFHGPERALSDEEKADQSRRDLINKRLETLKRPISWAGTASLLSFMMVTAEWQSGHSGISLGIALIALAIIFGLSHWGEHRIIAYFRDQQNHE